MAPKLDPWIRNFDVSEATKHRKGYTVYKVTSRVFPRTSPEAVSEVVVWKRYSDFKKLHKQMLTLHAKLYLSGTFPHFAKARLFGRFDGAVIEERRQSALQLLEFIAHHSPLFTSQIFVKFFEAKKDGDYIQKGTLPRSYTEAGPSRETKIENVSKISSAGQQNKDGQKIESPKHAAGSNYVSSVSDHTASQPILSPQKSLSTISEEQTSKKGLDSNVTLGLGGVWQYRQDQETISFSSESSEGETQATDSDSVLSMPLTGSDLSAFDPLLTTCAADVSEKHERSSNSWLLSALVACNHVDGDDSSQSGMSNGASFPKAFADYDEVDSSSVPKTGSPLSDIFVGDIGTGLPSVCPQETSKRSHSHSSTETKEDIHDSAFVPNCDSIPPCDSNLARNDKAPEMTLDGVAISRDVTPAPWSPISPLAPVVPSVIDHTGNYLFDAANYISLAQQNEANGQYEAAFTYYKAGVGRLLRGVQGDEDGARRDAVRRKTAQYLIRAEEIYKKYLANQVQDENRWGANSRLSPTIDRDPTRGLLKASPKELSCYKVLGIIDRVMLVLDTTSECTFVMKVLRKSSAYSQTSYSAASIVPSKIPYMVQLYKFIETDYAVFLVLQHATGGKLWNYVRSYLQTSPVSPSRDSEAGDYMNIHVDQTPTALGNVYSGKKLLSEDDSGFESKLFDNVVESPSELSSPENLASSTDLDLYAAPECSTSYVELFTNYAASLQPDKTVGLAKCSIKHQTCTVNQDARKTDSALRSATDSAEFKNLILQSTPVVSNTSSTIPQSECFINDTVCSKRPENQDLVPQVNQQDTLNHQTFVPSCDSEVGHESADDSSPACGLSHIRNMRDLEKLDAQDLISCAQRLLRNVDQTLRQSKANETVGNNALPATAVIADSSTRLPTSLAKQSVSRVSVDEVGLPCSGQCGIATCEENRAKTPVQVRQRRKSSSSSGSGIVQERRRSQRGMQRQFSDDSAFASPMHENRLSSSVGSLVGTSRPRLRHLSVVFQQLDSASGPHACLPESCVRVWAAEMVIAVTRLHAMGIICRDLRPDNILLGDRGHILLTYISQWGCVDKLVSTEAMENLYAAPEVSGILPPSPACDWWSIGALLFELLTSKTLISCHPGGIGSHTQLNIPAHVSAEAQSFLQELLRYNANERLGASSDGVDAIKSHPFFSTVNWDQLQV